MLLCPYLKWWEIVCWKSDALIENTHYCLHNLGYAHYNMFERLLLEISENKMDYSSNWRVCDVCVGARLRMWLFLCQ